MTNHTRNNTVHAQFKQYKHINISLCVLAQICVVIVMAPVYAQQAPLSISPLSMPAPTKPFVKPAAKPTPPPMPPIRPSELRIPADGQVQPENVSPPPSNNAVVARASPSQRLPQTEKEAVAFLNAYFNGFSVLSGNFIQFGADGRRVEGQFELHKPGRLRFDYNPPSPLEIIADGQSVAIRDKRLNTQDIYNLSQTPLKFLLNARVDLARETRILNVSPSEEMLKVSLEDKSTLGGTSQITLFYDAKTQNLSRWEVIDPQGLETSVAIYNLNKTRVPDPSRFRINQERILEDRR
jgi:outer membrane lipoprotein-sorting protein